MDLPTVLENQEDAFKSSVLSSFKSNYDKEKRWNVLSAWQDVVSGKGSGVGPDAGANAAYSSCSPDLAMRLVHLLCDPELRILAQRLAEGAQTRADLHGDARPLDPVNTDTGFGAFFYNPHSKPQNNPHHHQDSDPSAAPTFPWSAIILKTLFK